MQAKNKWESKILSLSLSMLLNKKWKDESYMKTKEIKGITLITLAVTIVVLLILAGISINTVIGDNGII